MKDDYVGEYVRDSTPEERMGFAVWDGEYEKFIVYEVLTHDMKVVACLGNAGHLNAIDGSGRSFEANGRTLARVREDCGMTQHTRGRR
jgi:hypothetical protein